MNGRNSPNVVYSPGNFGTPRLIKSPNIQQQSPKKVPHDEAEEETQDIFKVPRAVPLKVENSTKPAKENSSAGQSPYFKRSSSSLLPKKNANVLEVKQQSVKNMEELGSQVIHQQMYIDPVDMEEDISQGQGPKPKKVKKVQFQAPQFPAQSQAEVLSFMIKAEQDFLNLLNQFQEDQKNFVEIFEKRSQSFLCVASEAMLQKLEALTQKRVEILHGRIQRMADNFFKALEDGKMAEEDVAMFKSRMDEIIRKHLAGDGSNFQAVGPSSDE